MSVDHAVPVALPAAPKGAATKVHAKLSAPAVHNVHAAGPYFVQYAARDTRGGSINAILDDIVGDDDEDEDDTQDAVVAEENDDSGETEKELAAVLGVTPAGWDKQDHYAVIGIPRLRFRATENQIKAAYRKRILNHHPDKKTNPQDDSFFKCIQHAWEILSDPVTRRQWDSVDPQFDDFIPAAKTLKGKAFYEVYGPVFEKESRFSKVQPVPQLGDENTPREEVDRFYQFWLAMESWRSFENLDEKATEKGDNREEKRWLDKKNRTERAKRKKADIVRVNKLIEQALKYDPRIAMFKEADKLAKTAKKREAEAARVAEEKAAEEARIKKEAEEKLQQEAEAANAAAAKKKKEDAKKDLRKEKKTIKRIFRDNDNLIGADAEPSVLAEQLNKLDEILEGREPEDIVALREVLETAMKTSVEQTAKVFEEEYKKYKA